MNRLIGIMVLLVVLGVGPGFAQNSKVPVTGQTACWDEKGDLIACQGTGQDGDIQAGVPWQIDSRFSDNGDGTFTDNLTGLTWLQDGDCLQDTNMDLALFDMEEVMKGLAAAVEDAEDDGEEPPCKGLKKGSSVFSKDWRVPTVNELESLFGNFLPKGPAIVPEYLETEAGMIDIISDYGSSTTHPMDSNSFFGIDPTLGLVVAGSFSSIDILPVYGQGTGPAPPFATGQKKETHPGDGSLSGVKWPEPRFTDNKDGTVTDHLTGLMWLQDMLCLRGDWLRALEIVDEFNFNPGGAGFYCDSYTAFYSDWRLPNIKELQSLLDRSTYSPALPPDHPFKYSMEQYIGSELKQVRYFWTSTTITTDFNIAYTVDILKGHPNIGAKSKAVTEYAHVLPVRTTKTTGADADANKNKVLVNPASHNFKKVTKGQTPPLKYFTVTNNSDEKIKVDDVKILPGAGTNGTVYSNPASDCGSKALQPSETCTISVAFTPDSEGEKNATLQISTTGVDSSAGLVLNPKLTGEGVADQMYTVNVYRTGPGAANGSIASYDGGIACGEDCSETYPQGTMIQLYGTYFPENWSGPCKPTGTHCVIDSLEKDVWLAAYFEDLDKTRIDGDAALLLPKIKANGQEDYLEIESGTPLTLSISSDPGPHENQVGDYTLTLEFASLQKFYFDVVNGQWLQGDGISASGPFVLFDDIDLPALNTTGFEGTMVARFIQTTTEKDPAQQGYTANSSVSILITEPNPAN